MSALTRLRPLVADLAPVGTGRRRALSAVSDAPRLTRSLLSTPRTLHHRLAPQNLRTWRDCTQRPVLCNVCGHVGHPYYDLPDPTEERVYRCAVRRETVTCHSCGSTMRLRTVAAGLLDVMAERHGVQADTVEQLAERWPSGVQVLDTDVYTVINDRLAGLPGYVQSVYLEAEPNGTRLADGSVNVDLQQMPFPDAQFDLVITSEVMEHVRHVDVAHREIARCLKPGGRYLFTVPYDDDLERTWVLIDAATDEPVVLPVQYHGDAIRGRIKSYRVFGRDLVDDLREVGLDARFLRVERPEVGIFGGDLFLAERR